jgi:hypothetical protein
MRRAAADCGSQTKVEVDTAQKIAVLLLKCGSYPALLDMTATICKITRANSPRRRDGKVDGAAGKRCVPYLCYLHSQNSTPRLYFGVTALSNLWPNS